ncbi:MAG: hypothetical protein QGD94_00865, partial [Planctomycetia bacterium]|nr:hypothetical protein [Planctomycetia bacterium]
MKTFRLIAFAAMVTALCSLAAPAQTIPELEKQVADNPLSIKAKEALAETYLRECHLEKSLRVWQAILRHVPDHGRAGQVVSRLTLQALDLDSHLDVLDTLIEKGILRGTDALVEAAAQRAATDTQKARILYLRGKLALRRPNEARARESFETALRLYPDSRWSAFAAIDLADAECKGGRPTEARRRLREVIDNPKFKEDAVREAAMFKMALLASDGLTPAERVAALRDLLKVID